MALLSRLWNRDSDGPLRRNRIWIEGHFVVGMKAIPRWIDNRRRYKNNQVLLARRTRLTAEQTSYERQISEDGDLVFEFGDIFGNQTAQHHRLAIPDDCAGRDLTKPEVRQRQLGPQRNSGTTGPTANGLSLWDETAGIVVT